MTATPPAADPDLFLALDDLELAGRGLADAVWLGRHAGVRQGGGIEFHGHRPYEAGDDLRRINWSLYGRQRRLFTKESRQESRRPVHLIIDASASMGVAHGPHPKLRYAARAAAGIAFVASGQGDAPALCLLAGGGVSTALPARSGTAHLSAICATLSKAQPAAGSGGIAAALRKAASLCRSRGFVIFASDFFDDDPDLVGTLSQFRAQGHDVLALQILDPVEARLPESGDFEFIDAESGERLRTESEVVRDAHAAAVDAWRGAIQRACHDAGIRWQSATTADPLVPILRQWLGSR